MHRFAGVPGRGSLVEERVAVLTSPSDAVLRSLLGREKDISTTF